VIAVFFILLATVLTASLSLLLGNTLLQSLKIELHRSEAMFLSFVLGSSCLAVIVLGMSAAGLARKGAFFIMSAALLIALIWRGGHRFPRGEVALAAQRHDRPAALDGRPHLVLRHRSRHLPFRPGQHRTPCPAGR